MDVTISSRHTQMTEQLEDVTREKIGRLDRYLDGLDHAEVHFSEERNPRIADKEICEVTLAGHGHHVRCKVAAPDGFVAVDRAVAKLEKQLRKLKTQVVNRHHSGSKRTRGRMPPPDEARSIPFADRGPAIVKTKSFAIRPMTPAEAVIELELLDHGFFLFRNAETGRAAVLYQRDDGDYGLIDEDG